MYSYVNVCFHLSWFPFRCIIGDEEVNMVSDSIILERTFLSSSLLKIRARAQQKVKHPTTRKLRGVSIMIGRMSLLIKSYTFHYVKLIQMLVFTTTYMLFCNKFFRNDTYNYVYHFMHVVSWYTPPHVGQIQKRKQMD